MKPLVLAFSAACLALAVAACAGGGAESAGPVPSVPVETKTPAVSPAGPEQPAPPDTGDGSSATPAPPEAETPDQVASDEGEASAEPPAEAEAPAEPASSVPEVDYVIDLNTGETTPLPDAINRSVAKSGELSLHLTRYAASPDGSLLAYVATGEEGSLQIFNAGIDGTGVRQVTHDPTGATSPAWSPDGRMIAYQGYGGGGARNLFVLDVATGESTQITDEGVQEWAAPQFTRDGSSLLYTGGSDQYPVLRTVPVSGGKSTLLIGPGEGVTDAGNGSLSPDGSLVTFLGSGTPRSGKPDNCGPCRWVANADGTERRVIPGHVSNPAGTWSPDGGRIVCSEARRIGSGIIVVDIATGDASLVAKGHGAIWLDGHTLLVDAV